MRVMVVDDTTFMRITLKRMLEGNDHQVVAEAENGLEAIKKYKIYWPDLVIMDISMPIMDGLQAVKAIIKEDSKANIIICSLQGQKQNVLDAIKSGAKTYLTKPIKEEKLLKEMAKITLSKDNTSPTENDIKPRTDWSEDYLKGVSVGYLEARREVATNMLRMGIDLKTVMHCVEMSQSEVENYKKEFGI